MYATLNEMGELGFLKSVPTAALRDGSKDLLLGVNLYVADALNLATAVVNASDLLTEDRHLLNEEAKEVMGKTGLKLIRLKEAYSGASG